MRCDYEALDDYRATLNRIFNSVVKSFNGIEDSLKTITSSNNWSGDARDYFSSMSKCIIDDFNIVNNKFTNTIQYLDSVVDNYRSFDK